MKDKRTGLTHGGQEETFEIWKKKTDLMNETKGQQVILLSEVWPAGMIIIGFKLF